MALAVRRVGGTAFGEQTYTLKAHESLRLDSVSFAIDQANEGTWVIPTVTATSSGGATIAEIAAPAVQLTPPALGPFTYTGPAAMTDDFSLIAPGGYTGWLLHDFGAGIVTSQITFNWTQPPGLRDAFGITWLHSPGAVSMTPDIGIATVVNSDTITVTLTGPIAAGKYLLLHLDYIDSTGLLTPDLIPPPIVTDSVGGNQLDFSGHATFGFSTHAIQRADGRYLSSAVEFYRIVNPLSTGDTVTLTLPHSGISWLRMDVLPVTGLTVGNPIGPNAGGNFVGIGGSKASPPDTTAAVPTPKWLGGVLINSSYLIDGAGVGNAMFARGGVDILPLFGGPFTVDTSYFQVPLPELHLSQNDTVTVSSQDINGLRDGDEVSDFLLYGMDE